MFIVLTIGHRRQKMIVNTGNILRIDPSNRPEDGNSVITFNCSINQQYGSYLANVTVHEDDEDDEDDED